MPADRMPREMSRFARDMHQEIDRLTELRLKNTTVSCKAGCAHCCYVVVWTTLLEAMAVARHVAIHHAALVENVKQTCRAQLEALRDPNMDSDKYLARRWPCVFLDDQNRCRVYPVRPSPCRLLYVTTPASACATQNETSIIIEVDFNPLHKLVVDAVEGALREANIPVWVLPLQVNLLWSFVMLEQGTQECINAVLATPHEDVMSPIYWARLMLDPRTPMARDIARSAKRRKMGDFLNGNKNR